MTSASALSLSALAGMTTAHAAIVTNTDLGLTGFVIGSVTENSYGWDIDGENGAEITVYGNNNSMSFINPRSFFGILATSSFRNAADLENIGYSANVQAGRFLYLTLSSFFRSGYFGNALYFTSGEPGYIGFRFIPSGGLIDTYLYGWAEVILTESFVNPSLDVVRWAYEDTGATIFTPSAVPESETAALGLAGLALGAAGLRRWRKTKQAA